jgi:hypothetical protein
VGQHQERREKSRADKLEAITAAVADGSLKVRQASEAERAAWTTAATTGPGRSNSSGPAPSDAGARLPQRTPDLDQPAVVHPRGDSGTDRGPGGSFTAGSGSNGAGAKQRTPAADLEGEHDGD